MPPIKNSKSLHQVRGKRERERERERERDNGEGVKKRMDGIREGMRWEENKKKSADVLSLGDKKKEKLN